MDFFYTVRSGFLLILGICITVTVQGTTDLSMTTSTTCAGKPYTVTFDTIEPNMTLAGSIRYYIPVGTKEDLLCTYVIATGVMNIIMASYKGRLSVSGNRSLTLQNVQKSDETTYVMQGTDGDTYKSVSARKNLSVIDPCFDVDSLVKIGDKMCSVAVCSTSNGGFLMKGNSTMTAMNVTVCDMSSSGNYSCCAPEDPPKCVTERVAPDQEAGPDGSDHTGLIVGLVMVAIFLSVAIAVAVFRYRKNKKKRGDGYKAPSSSKPDNV